MHVTYWDKYTEMHVTYWDKYTEMHGQQNVKNSVSVLNCNFSREQSMLPEDDRMIETCRNVLSVLM